MNLASETPVNYISIHGRKHTQKHEEKKIRKKKLNILNKYKK